MSVQPTLGHQFQDGEISYHYLKKKFREMNFKVLIYQAIPWFTTWAWVGVS